MSDIYEGKRTFLVEQALDCMDSGDKNRFDYIFGNPTASNQDIEYIRTLFISTGAKSKTEKMIIEYASAHNDRGSYNCNKARFSGELSDCLSIRHSV